MSLSSMKSCMASSKAVSAGTGRPLTGSWAWAAGVNAVSAAPRARRRMNGAFMGVWGSADDDGADGRLPRHRLGVDVRRCRRTGWARPSAVTRRPSSRGAGERFTGATGREACLLEADEDEDEAAALFEPRHRLPEDGPLRPRPVRRPHGVARRRARREEVARADGPVRRVDEDVDPPDEGDGDV